jgi:transmembrane sensor
MKNSASVTQTAADWFVRLREPDITPAEIGEWIAWCEAAPAHRDAFQSIQALWNATAAIEEAPIDPRDLAAENDIDDLPVPDLGARAGPARQKREAHRSGRTWAAAAAMAGIAIGTALFLAFSVFRPDSITTPTGINRKISLPDRTEVILAAGSTLTSRYDADSRNVSLERGEAYFQVQKDPARPFVVRTGAARITAVGTAFNVRNEGGMLRVNVTEGAVDVRSRSRNSRVNAGEQYLLTVEDPVPEIQKAPSTRANAWMDGTLQFSNERLLTVVAAINRYAKQPVTLDDPGLQSLHFTGTVDAARIDEWLQGLPNIFPVTVDRPDSGPARISRRE